MAGMGVKVKRETASLDWAARLTLLQHCTQVCLFLVIVIGVRDID